MFRLLLTAARRALKNERGPRVNAMRDIDIKKKAYTQPEFKTIGPAAVVRERLLKHRETQAKLTQVKGIRAVLFIDDARNMVGNIETSAALKGAKRLCEETVEGASLCHFKRPPFSTSERTQADVLVLDLRPKRTGKPTFLADLSARKELRGIPLVILIQSMADSLAIRASDLHGNHSFTGPVNAEYFDMALASFLDLWAPF
jgi:hypothetical protein